MVKDCSSSMVCSQMKHSRSSSPVFSLVATCLTRSFNNTSLYMILLKNFLHNGHVFSVFRAQASMHSKQNLWSQHSIRASHSVFISSMQMVQVSLRTSSVILAKDSLLDSTCCRSLLFKCLPLFLFD